MKLKKKFDTKVKNSPRTEKKKEKEEKTLLKSTVFSLKIKSTPLLIFLIMQCI
jgi:hypothetical protein